MPDAQLTPEPIRVPGYKGLSLAVDRWRAPGAQPVVLLHGGGQTRHAWGETGAVLAARGYDVTSMDLRGHGESFWSEDGDYQLDAFRDDLRYVLEGFDRPAVLIGASLGGIATLLVAGEGPRERVKAVVLVDITHHAHPEGAAKITGFMTANPNGFASIDDAAAAVAAYLPHRRRPPSPRGLMKNLRERDGRLYWHWDPSFLKITAADRGTMTDRLQRAVEHVAAPMLLVRGDGSEIVSPENARDFLGVAPHAEFVEVKGAAHMVAGDQNTVFGEALLDFLSRTAPPISIDRRFSDA